MAKKVEALVLNQTYNLNDGNPFRLVNARGFGLPPTNRLGDVSPGQNGFADLGFRSAERNLFLTLQVVGATPAQLETYKDLLFEIFKPLTSIPVRIRVTREDDQIRQIDTFYSGFADLEFLPERKPGNLHRVIVPLVAPRPFWYDPVLQNLTFSIVDSALNGFQVPALVPYAQTTGSSIDAVESVTYSGNWESFPVIYITGPGEDVVITNITTGKKLDFTGGSIAAGDIYTINTQADNKSVTNVAGSSVYDKLTLDSDLDNWAFVPSPRAPGGINDVRVTVADLATDATRVRVEYHRRYAAV